MQTFSDKNGQAWAFEITVTDVKAIAGETGTDIYAIADDGFEPLGKLLDDPVKVVEVLWVLCKEQAEERALSPESFGRLFSGDVIEQAAEALLSAIIDFFPRARTREAMTKIVNKSRRLRDLLTDEAMEQIEALDVDEEAERLKSTFTKSQGSSGSILGR